VIARAVLRRGQKYLQRVRQISDTWAQQNQQPHRLCGCASGGTREYAQQEISAMNRVRFSRKQLTAFVCFLVAGALGLAGQAKPTNLFKEVMDRKDKIVWRNAPANSIPRDVCVLLEACAGAPDKLIALPKVTEGGRQVARGLFLSRSNDGKKADMVILLRQTPLEAYFFSLAPDGTVQKAAYWATGKPWVAMGVAISRSISDKDRQVWLDHVAKL
jgi:hypothetical protein